MIVKYVKLTWSIKVEVKFEPKLLRLTVPQLRIHNLASSFKVGWDTVVLLRDIYTNTYELNFVVFTKF